MCALIFIGAVIPTIAIQFVASRHEDTLDCASQDE
jgi:hypothetical protein